MANQIDRETIRRMIEGAGLLTQSEASRRAGVSRQAIHDWIEAGALPCVKIEGAQLVFLNDLEEFLKRRATKYRTMADVAAESISRLKSQPHRGRHLEE